MCLKSILSSKLAARFFLENGRSGNEIVFVSQYILSGSCVSENGTTYCTTVNNFHIYAPGYQYNIISTLELQNMFHCLNLSSTVFVKYNNSPEHLK